MPLRASIKGHTFVTSSLLSRTCKSTSTQPSKCPQPNPNLSLLQESSSHTTGPCNLAPYSTPNSSTSWPARVTNPGLFSAYHWIPHLYWKFPSNVILLQEGWVCPAVIGTFLCGSFFQTSPDVWWHAGSLHASSLPVHYSQTGQSLCLIASSSPEYRSLNISSSWADSGCHP